MDKEKKLYKPPYTITPKVLSLTASVVEELTKIENNSSKLITPKLRKKNRVKTIAGTLEIEGNFLGEEKITAILEGKKVLGTMFEIAEVEGAINAYKELENYKYTELDELLRAHQILMQGVLKTAGAFRTVNVGIGSSKGIKYVAPPHKLVSEFMRKLFDWLKYSEEHPLIKSCVFHYEFEFIHPFADGNGRIGRLWQTVILYNWKKIFNSLPVESIIRDNQAEYYKVLEDAGKKEDSSVFIEFMLEVILKTLKKLKRKNVPRNVPKNVPLNRHDEILKLIANNKFITIQEIATKLSVADKTIKRDIAKLKEANKIKRLGSLKTGYWELI